MDKSIGTHLLMLEFGAVFKIALIPYSLH